MNSAQKEAHARMLATLKVHTVLKVDARRSGDFNREELVYHRNTKRGKAISFGSKPR